jgi:uncharacterized cofD-like protein
MSSHLPSSSAAKHRGLKVVAIGGGTGLATLLRGLKRYVRAPGEAEPGGPFISSLSAVVTVSDDGGSSGKLRKDFNIPPPGDIRNCIVALSQDEALLARLFQFRFPEDSALSGHNFGNLFLAALNQMTGDFGQAVELSSAVLKTKGRIFPATTANVELAALMHDGSVVLGETRINGSEKRIVELSLLPPDVRPLPEALDAIADADLITVGPGSLYTSLICNLLVPGIPEAIAESRALKVFVCNLMSEANESLGLDAVGHLWAVYRHAKRPIFDYVLVNSRPVSPGLAALYAEEGACQVTADTAELQRFGVEPVMGDFLEEEGVARHATDRVAAELMRLAQSTPPRVKVKVNVE